MVKIQVLPSINLGYIGEQAGAYSYSYGGDMNGDRISNNDLIFVPNNANEIRFQSLSVTNVVNGANVVTVYTEAQQQQAYEAFINQDSYLSTRRGQYVERNGSRFTYVNRLIYLLLKISS
jgi:hypothetical protein